jgi:hypothetical protein
MPASHWIASSARVTSVVGMQVVRSALGNVRFGSTADMPR